jgi:hypothetical protein
MELVKARTIPPGRIQRMFGVRGSERENSKRQNP